MTNYKPINGFSDYIIGDDGKIFRINAWKDALKMTSGNVNLYRDGKPFRRSVARLVAEHFIRPVLPSELVVHKEGKCCAVSNLEIVSKHCARSNSTSAHPGVYFCSSRMRWGATLTHNAKKRHIGYFKTEHAASAAYERELAKVSRLDVALLLV